MSDPNPTTIPSLSTEDPTLTELQDARAEIDRLNAELEARDNQVQQSPKQPLPESTMHATEVTVASEDKSTSKTAIGVGNDPRGGYVVGFSDGTVTLQNVPDQRVGDPPESKAAEPWGDAPEGEYSHFFVDSGTGRYGFIKTDGEIVHVDNPVTVHPPA